MDKEPEVMAVVVVVRTMAADHDKVMVVVVAAVVATTISQTDRRPTSKLIRVKLAWSLAVAERRSVKSNRISTFTSKSVSNFSFGVLARTTFEMTKQKFFC